MIDSQGIMGVALTVQDVEKLQAVSLKLVHRKLQALPHGKGYVPGQVCRDVAGFPC